MKRKCSICGEVKEELYFRFMKHRGRYNSYCKDCERWYMKNYMKSYREIGRK